MQTYYFFSDYMVKWLIYSLFLVLTLSYIFSNVGLYCLRPFLISLAEQVQKRLIRNRNRFILFLLFV